MRRLLLLGLLSVCLNTSIAQSSVVANARLNVVYLELVNELSVSSSLVSRSDLKMTSDVGVLIDSNGRYFLDLRAPECKKSKSVVFKLYDMSKSGTPLVDSVLYRVKRIPHPFIQLGSLSSGGIFRLGEIALQQRVYAVISGFTFDGVKYIVVSYRVKLFDTNQKEIMSMEIYNNSTAQFNSMLSTLKENARLEFDNIKCVLVNGTSQNADTLLVNPVVYYINFDGTKKNMGDFYGNSKISYYSKTFEYVENGEIKSYTEEFKCVGKDSLLLNKKLTSFGKVSYYESFNKETGKREMVITRNSDTSYNINYYKDEHLFAVGRSRNFQMELYPVRRYGEKNAIGGRDTLIHFMEEQYLQPFGTWRFFGPNMQLIKEGVLRFNREGRGSVEWVYD